MLKLINIGGSKLDETTNVLTVQAQSLSAQDDNPDDSDQYFSDISFFGTLGLVARPYPATDEGSAQGLVEDESQAFVVASRDTRIADVYGVLSPGDVALTSTGPVHASRIMLKEESRNVVLMSKDENAKDIVLNIDGQNEKITITGFKQVFEMSRENGITMGIETSTGSSSISMRTDGSIWIAAEKIYLNGTLYLGANLALAGTPLTAVCIGPAGISAVASTSVFASP